MRFFRFSFFFLPFLLIAAASSARSDDDFTISTAPVVISSPIPQAANVPTPTVTISTFTAPDPANTVVLTLPQCIQKAIEQATVILKAKKNADVTGTQLVQAYMQFLPNLEANANYGYQTGRFYYTQSVPTFVRTTNRGGLYQLSSTLNIFNGFSDVGGWRSSTGKKQAADLSLYRAKQQIAFDITQIYLQVYLDRQIVKINESNLQASRQQEELIDAQTQVGSRSLADLYRQQAATSADELSLISARAQMKNDLIQLLQRIRVDLLTPYDIAAVTLDMPATTAPYGDEATLVRQGLKYRADLDAQEKLARAATWDVTSARSGYFPQLNLVGTMDGTATHLNSQDVDGVNAVPANQPTIIHQFGSEIVYDVGLNLSWGLFDRYLTRLTVARAQEVASDSAIDAEDRRLQVEGDVAQALNDYQAAVQQVASAEKGLKAAEESYEAVQERYKVGASSIVDLLTAQSALVQAQASQVQARSNFTLQERAIELALGTLAPR